MKRAIFTCINKGFINPSIVWLSGLLDSLSHGACDDVEIIIFHNGGVDKSRYGRLSDTFTLREIASTAGYNSKYDRETTEAMTLRLRALDVLSSEGYDVVYYLDADTDIRDGIEGLLDTTPLTKKWLIGRYDFQYDTDSAYKNLYIKNSFYLRCKAINKHYINSGVLVVNLEGMRRHLSAMKCNTLMSLYSRNECCYLLPDQDFINTLHGASSTLERRYNAYVDVALGDLVNTGSVEQIESELDNAVVMHWILNTKPWVEDNQPYTEQIRLPFQRYMERCEQLTDLLDSDFVEAVRIKTLKNSRGASC